MTNDFARIDTASLRSDLKHLIVTKLHLEGLTPDEIGDDQPLFGEGLGLDSVDALELMVALEKQFGLKIQSHEVDKSVFASVAALADFVSRSLPRSPRAE